LAGDFPGVRLKRVVQPWKKNERHHADAAREGGRKDSIIDCFSATAQLSRAVLTF
jgi:hypothetical protein